MTILTHINNRKDARTPIARFANGALGSRMAAYNRAMRDNTIAMSREEGNDYTPTYLPNVKYTIDFDTTDIEGRMYHAGTEWFRPQTEGQHGIDAGLTGDIPLAAEFLPDYADDLGITTVRLWLVTKAIDNTLQYRELGANYAHRYWDARINAYSYSILTGFSIQASVVVDHKVGTAYALAFEHNGLGSITTMSYFKAYMAMHYYGKALVQKT